MNSFDNIFAQSTPNFRSAIHLHRLSGNGIFKLLSPFLFLPKSQEPLTKGWDKIITRYLILKNEDGEIIDDVIVTFFPNPRSYTGEDIIEISTHGNPLIALKLHSFLRKTGFRDAQPGEFTKRALLNGKLDLVKAEGIQQLIHAESFGAIELARNSVDGVLSQEIQNIRQDILKILAYLEAHIDFSPDEVGTYSPQEVLPIVESIKLRLHNLYASYENGIKIKEGLKIVLCGRPNSGKSSLYNALLKSEKAIVTNIPGTTRDILENKLLIENKEFVLLDTAGIRESHDEVEKIGIARTLASLNEADIICYLIDSTTENKENEFENFKYSLNLKETQKIIPVFTKNDLFSNDKSCFFLSISRDNFQSLLCKLSELYDELMGGINIKSHPTLISQRQKDKVFATLQHIEKIEELIQNSDFPEKIASIVNSSRLLLEEITGEISIDNVYNLVFSTFCIGK